MTEIADALFVEAEIKEHQAALMRQMIAVEIIICAMLIWVGCFIDASDKAVMTWVAVADGFTRLPMG